MRPDRDGDGHIEPKEIKTVMSQLGTPISDEQVKVLIAGVDTDGNGMVRTAPSRLARDRTRGPPVVLGVCARRVAIALSRTDHAAPLALLLRATSSQIEFDEFVGIMAARMLKADGDGELEQAFSLFDDASGCAATHATPLHHTPFCRACPLTARRRAREQFRRR